MIAKKRVAEAINSIDLNGDPVEQLTHFMDLVYDYGQNHLEDMLLIREFNQSPLLSQLNIDVKVAYAALSHSWHYQKRASRNKNLSQMPIPF
ncbi:hypothetical protein [Secundilactobacillus silagei]|uniref:hypothetical protein n=1 Tax=Secundilactobacillus silagei TaxID=1293415 RepID=UPI0006CF2C0B|nr:hypothetical protein [Secundilactobacillus silagei]